MAVEDDDSDPPPNLPTRTLSEDQAALQDIQQSFAPLLVDSPGCTSLAEIAINTGDSTPFQSVPYSTGCFVTAH